jgi:GT2 family glycosyltransferase
MTVEKELSIIIVNWHSAPYLRRCLTSIFHNAGDVDLEIIVVDNASFDGSADMVNTEFPAVKFFQSTENLGFARANNFAFNFSHGRNLLFLNPDTEIVGSAIATLLSALALLPDSGIVGPELLNADGSLQSSVKAFPTILNQILDADFLQRRFPEWPLWGLKPLLRARETMLPAKVAVLYGACLMMTRQLFEMVAMFTPHYFMYTEDVDLCYKVRRAGLCNYYVPNATVVHHGGRSSAFASTSSFAAVTMRESHLTFLRSTRGRIYAASYRCTVGIVAMLRLCVLWPLVIITLAKWRRQPLGSAREKWAALLAWSVGLRRARASPGSTRGLRASQIT